MSRCGKTEQLEAMVLGELDSAYAHELTQHTSHCAVCHHELNWLKSERVMFEHRLARDTVRELWSGFAAKRAKPGPGPRQWARVALAVAASAIIVLGLTARQPAPRLDEGASFDASLPMSLEEMSRDRSASARDCSQLQPGTGFACGPFLPASFALRE